MIDEFSMPVRVYIEDTDAGGIVYYVNYLKFMERARTEYMREIGFDKPAIFDNQLMFVVHSLSVNYQKPAELDDQLRVTARMTKFSKVSFHFEQKVIRGDELLCEANVRVACVSQGSRQPSAIPGKMLEKFKQIVNTNL